MDRAEPRGLATADDQGRHNSNATMRQVLEFVRLRAGDDGVAEVLERAGELRTIEELEDLTGWSSYWQGRLLLEASAEVLGGSDELRNVGEAWVRVQAPGEVISLLQALGSPGEVLRTIAETAAKFSTVVRMEAVEVGAGYGVVAAEAVKGFPRYREFCDYTAGLLAISPLLFGLPRGEVLETQCQVRGDDRCLFLVRWDEASADATDPTRRIIHLEAELAVALTRLEALTTTVGELVSGDDVDAVLTRITEAAAGAVRAPCFVLAVRPTDDSPVTVQQRGLGDDEVAAITDEVLEEAPNDRGGCRLIADVVSGRRWYGRLAAINPDGMRFFPGEHKVLTAYAKLAAAALDSATALTESRRQATTAQALLSLARTVADVGTREEMARRLAACIPAVVDCDRSSVYLWSEEEQTARLAAASGYHGDLAAEVSGLLFPSSDSGLLERLVHQREPMFLLRDEIEDELVRDVMDRTGNVASVAVPIVGGDRFFGLVSASVVDDPTRLRRDRHLLDRLSGLADHAATAFQNGELLERIQHQAMHDALTGAANHRLLQDRMANAIAMAERGEELIALLFLDLDRLKVVNDSLGHGYGDELLRQVAVRLEGTARMGDTVARIGGDEFALLLPRLRDREEAEEVAKRVLDVLRQPFDLSDQAIFVSASIGLATFPTDGQDFDSLVQKADTAMYRAKAAGRSTYRWHTPAVVDTPTGSLALESDLHQAVERDELRIYFQPQVDLTTFEIISAEALVRWEHPRLGLLPPAEFLPLAEQSALISEIDAWMLRRACEQARRWRDAGLPPIRVAVNVANRDLRTSELLDTVAEVLDETALEPSSLELEVTEQVAGAEREELTLMFEKLSGLGVGLAIDDFGTGHSTLTRLTTGQFDTLKIDRSFIAEIHSPSDDAPLVTAVISLGQGLGARVVAEGVETAAQVEFLRRHGCHLAQGYFFGRPLDVHRFEAELRDQTMGVAPIGAPGS